MKTVEILYQAFRVRYSLNRLQYLLDRGCRIALLGPDDAVGTLKGYFGDPVTSLDGNDPSEDLVELSWELGEADIKELKTCDACLVLFGDGPPEIETLRELAKKIPIHVKTVWMCLVDQPKGGTYHEKDLTLPTVQALPKARAQKRFIKLLILALPQVVIILARNWTSIRSQFCKTLTRRTSLRNGVRAGLSSLPLRSVPVIGPVLSMLATSAETMMLTASQLRLSFVIAAAHNRPLDFFDRISELWPIIGSAYGLRGMSRALVKMLPSAAPPMKASIAFSGTYAIGEACRLYYEYGQPTSDEVRRELVRLSHEAGAKEAARLFRKVLAGQSLEEVEEQELGGELLEAVDNLTEAEKKKIEDDLDDLPDLRDEPNEALEPTVEMDAAVGAKDALKKNETKSSEEEPKAKKAKKSEAAAAAGKKDDKKVPESKKSSKPDDAESKGAKSKDAKSKDAKPKDESQDSKSEKSEGEDETKKRKPRKPRSKKKGKSSKAKSKKKTSKKKSSKSSSKKSKGKKKKDS